MDEKFKEFLEFKLDKLRVLTSENFALKILNDDYSVYDSWKIQVDILNDEDFTDVKLKFNFIAANTKTDCGSYYCRKVNEIVVDADVTELIKCDTAIDVFAFINCNIEVLKCSSLSPYYRVVIIENELNFTLADYQNDDNSGKYFFLKHHGYFFPPPIKKKEVIKEFNLDDQLIIEAQDKTDKLLARYSYEKTEYDTLFLEKI
jgi:hypothetical protein